MTNSLWILRELFAHILIHTVRMFMLCPEICCLHSTFSIFFVSNLCPSGKAGRGGTSSCLRIMKDHCMTMKDHYIVLQKYTFSSDNRHFIGLQRYHFMVTVKAIFLRFFHFSGNSSRSAEKPCLQVLAPTIHKFWNGQFQDFEHIIFGVLVFRGY